MGPPDSSPHLAGVPLAPRAGRRAGSTAIQQVGQSLAFPPATETGCAPRKTWDMEADGDQWGAQESSLTPLFLENTRIVPGLWLLTPIFPSLFIVFKIWQVALAPDATVARSPRVPWTTDHRCRPVEPAALVLNVYACVPRSLPVPFLSPSVNVSR